MIYIHDWIDHLQRKNSKICIKPIGSISQTTKRNVRLFITKGLLVVFER